MKRISILLLTWLALLALLGVAVAGVALAPGPLTHAVAVGCSVFMAALVMVFFMDLHHTTPLLRLFAVGSVLWLGFMAFLILADFLAR